MLSRVPRILALAALALACAERLEPAPLPADAVPFGAPPVYARWWADVEACSGRQAPLARVRWFVVPRVDAFIADGQRDSGLWIGRYRYIVLAESGLSDGLLVRHEMLHDLLDRAGHPAEYFTERCRGVVSPY
jgi:hypothetical protein